MAQAKLATEVNLVGQGINVADLFLLSDAPISAAIASIDRCNGEIALVVDGDGRLIGTVTDGDVRRGLLRGRTLQEPVSIIMNPSPRSGIFNHSRSELRAIMERADIQQLPILDEGRRVINLVLLQDLLGATTAPNWVVLMAGGMGTRLLPLTETLPKPMISIGGKPIMQTIIESFVSQGFYRFVISLNYLGEKITEYFGDGARFGAEILYVNETKRLGTAGALSLLPTRPTEPIFVMNGDILTSTNFSAMMRFHEKAGAMATMGVNHYHYKVPYGVVEVSGERITSLREKPEYDFFVSSGIYVISPTALDSVPNDEFFDMPALFHVLLSRRDTTAAFPIHEHWLDIGQPHDLQRAEDQYETVFNDQTKRRRNGRSPKAATYEDRN